MESVPRLHRAPGIALEVPPAAPGLCETCRQAPARRGRYCDRVCSLFDDALAELAAAIHAADGNRRAPAVVLARTRLRAVAAVYDGRKLRRGRYDRLMHGTAASWDEDIDDGLLLPVDYQAAVDEVCARL